MERPSTLIDLSLVNTFKKETVVQNPKKEKQNQGSTQKQNEGFLDQSRNPFPIQYLVFKIPICIVKVIGTCVSLDNSYQILLSIIMGAIVYLVSLVLGAMWYFTGRRCSQKGYMIILLVCFVSSAEGRLKQPLEIGALLLTSSNNNLAFFAAVLGLLCTLIESISFLVVKHYRGHNPFRGIHPNDILKKGFREFSGFIKNREQWKERARDMREVMNQVAWVVKRNDDFTEETPRTKHLKTCLMCLEEYDYFDKLAILKRCKHHFHEDCLRKHFQVNKMRCPQCLKSVRQIRRSPRIYAQ